MGNARLYRQVASYVLLGIGLIALPGCSVIREVFTKVKMVMEPAVPTSECTLESVGMGRLFETLFPTRIDSIPEFHDCQRFLEIGDDGKLHYTTAFAVFATESLGGLWDRVKEGVGDVVFGTAAVVWAWDGDYAPLGIKKGFNCVYLGKRTEAGIPVPIAVVIPTFPPCPPVGIEATLLHVRLATVPGFSNPADYPVAARWQWDTTSKQYYFGINCGSAGWCDLYDRTKPAPPVTQPVRGADRVAAIPGWYDQQILAGRPEGDVPSVTGVTGTVVPDRDIGSHTTATFKNTWVPVAYVAMSRNEPMYYATYGFVAADFTPRNLRKMNRVELCHGKKRDCGVPASLKCYYPNLAEDQYWWVRVTSAPPSFWSNLTGIGLPTWPYVPHQKFLCAERMGHSGRHIPGTVRWRWTKYDETIWIRCGEGCCEVDS